MELESPPGPAALPQLAAAAAVSFGAMTVGGWLSFTSVAIPKLMAGGNYSSNSSHSPSAPCTQAV